MNFYTKKIVALGVLAALVVGACGDDEADGEPSKCTPNGIVEDGEECDGNVGTANCTSATMGAKPTGTLACTNCKLDASGCTASGSPGTGGTGG